MDGGNKLNRKEAARPLFLRSASKYAALAVLALAAGMGAAVTFTGLTRNAATAPLSDRVTGRFILHAEPKPMPDLAFKDAEGHAVRLSDWRGRMVLVNLWATWCAPCKIEMPSLDRLQGKLGNNLVVVALSTDRGGPEAPAKFFASQRITRLKLYNDTTGEAVIRMKVTGLPVSIVVNETGQEIARLVGPADWDSPEISGQLEALQAGGATGRAGSPAVVLEGNAMRP